MCPSPLTEGCICPALQINTCYYILLYRTTNYWCLMASRKDSNVHWPQHGMDIQAATIGRQRWEVEASEIFCVKLVKKVSDFLREVALTELATSTHPNWYCDSHSQAAGGWCRVSAVQLAQILQRMPRKGSLLGSSPCSPRTFHHLSARRGACMTRSNSHVSYCQSLSLICAALAIKNIHYYALWYINAHYLIIIHSITSHLALSTRRTVLTPLGMPRAESSWLTFDPGLFTFSLCEVWAALQMQLIRLPNLIISNPSAPYSESSHYKSTEAPLHIHPSDSTVRMSIELAGSARVCGCNL